MSVEIKFEVENKPERSGIVAENTYLWDAAKRLGVYLKTECGGQGRCDTCAVTILEGAANLSTPTSGEMHHLSDARRERGDRLACQTRIQRSGEIVAAVKETVEDVEEEKERDLRREFQELPLEKKFSTLVEIEAVALSETMNFIANLPRTLGNKVVDLLAGFGKQIDRQSRTTRRPSEHRTETKES